MNFVQTFSVLVGVVVLVKSQALQRHSYGGFCNETIKCDKKSWLGCKDNVCSCILENEMVFNAEREKCVSKAGERCKFQISDINLDKTLISLYEEAECVPNAICERNDHFCVCLVDFYESTNGSCAARKHLNDTCTSVVECGHTLQCINGNCQCKDSLVFGLPSHDTVTSEACYGRAGTPVKVGTLCINGATEVNGTCVCTPTEIFYNGQDGRCHPKKDHGSNCTSDNECMYKDRFLMCINGTCSCKADDSQFYGMTKYRQEERKIESYGRLYQRDSAGEIYIRTNSGHKRGYKYRQDPANADYYYLTTSAYNETVVDIHKGCVGLAGKSCNPDGYCVENASCEGTLCTCDAIYSITSIGTCGAGFGENCSNTIPCSDSFICTEEKCNCASVDHQIYDLTLDKCIGLIHAPCSTEFDCIKYSRCEYNNKTEYKQCRCVEGFVENGLGGCELAYGSNCTYLAINSGERCDTFAGLQCRNGKCSCPDSLSHFDNSIRKCLRLVGSVCKEDRNSPHGACITNAFCVLLDGQLTGQCMCKAGFHVTVDKFCSVLLPPYIRYSPKVE